MSLRFALLLLWASLCTGCVLSGDFNPMKTSKGRDEAREAYVQLGIGYLQQGMTERAKSFREKCGKRLTYDIEYFFKMVDENPQTYQRER